MEIMAGKCYRLIMGASSVRRRTAQSWQERGTMARELRVLGFHGLGDHRASCWALDWENLLRPVLDPKSETALQFSFPTYDPIFESTRISFGETLGAFWKLARSGIGQIGRRERGLISNVSEQLRWTAGYVVAWLEDEKFQKQTQEFVLEQIRTFKPDVILAHSLGSLITYNTLAHGDATDPAIKRILAKAHYVTFGSQIGNPFVIGNLTFGRVNRLPVRFWHHLYNEHDDVFTAPLNVQGVDNFQQLLTPFDLPGRGDHDALGYLGHQVTVHSVWQPLAGGEEDARAKEIARGWKSGFVRKRDPRRKALLVGINEYPDPAQRLEGCVNDVFTMSAVLQECGFEPDEIRTCLDDRATAAGILERMKWLVDEAQPEDDLVFYYSGHGARVPEYGEFQEPDHLTETLVPYDFDWSPETSVSDEQIYALYSQLPYDTRLTMIFDCCHSGGMHRQGGARPRGITPPDDIRHRALKWDTKTEMWVDRDFERFDRRFNSRNTDRVGFFGANGATVRLGRAAMLRFETQQTYKKAIKTADGPLGPYMPLIIQACQEEQLSYEYRHGATSYGAFTFCLASLLRKEKNISFEQLVKLTAERLADLQYQQRPEILGPTSVREAKVPFNTGQAKGEPVRSGVPGAATPRTSG